MRGLFSVLSGLTFNVREGPYYLTRPGVDLVTFLGRL